LARFRFFENIIFANIFLSVFREKIGIFFLKNSIFFFWKIRFFSLINGFRYIQLQNSGPWFRLQKTSKWIIKEMPFAWFKQKFSAIFSIFAFKAKKNKTKKIPKFYKIIISWKSAKCNIWAIFFSIFFFGFLIIDFLSQIESMSEVLWR